MIQVSSSFRWSNLALVSRAKTPSSISSAVTILDRAKNELTECGANTFSPIADNTFTFGRRWFSWGRTWMGLLSGGEVQVTQLQDGVSLIVRARLGRLLMGHLIFFSVGAFEGLPLAFNLGINVFVMLANATIAQWGLRGVARRALSGGAA